MEIENVLSPKICVSKNTKDINIKHFISSQTERKLT